MAVATGQTSSRDTANSSWQELRASEDIQFAPVEIPVEAPREPTWLDRFFEWLGQIIGDLVSGPLAAAWPVLRWVLLALLIAAVAYMLWQIFDPFAGRRKAKPEDEKENAWQPDHGAAVALLEDADRLAAQGLFDEATHLLLQRSVSQIASARPGWVEPSSTARELAQLQALPGAARDAFGIIAERVERSLFALSALDQQDWQTARAAYAEFALAKLERQA